MGDLSIFIIFLLVVSALLGVDFIFYVVYVVLGIYAISYWYTPRAGAKLRVTRSFSEHAFLGEEVAVEVTIENKGRLPVPWLQVTESVPANLQMGDAARYAFSMSGRQKIAFTYRIHATRRGYYRVGPLQTLSGDFFGFSESTGYVEAAYLTVYPRITALSGLALRSRLPFGTIASRQRLFEDPARPAGVRNYHTGDSLRQINWKVSAHVSGASHDLMVKTLEPAISLETAILLNLHRDDYWSRTVHDVAEWAIETAASLAAYLSGARQAVGLMTNGNDPLIQGADLIEALPFDKESGRLLLNPAEDTGSRRSRAPAPVTPKSGRAHLMKILEILARVEISRETPFGEWAPGATVPLSWGVTLLVISPRGDEATCNVLHRMVRAGYNPVLLLVEKRTGFGVVRERARRLGFSAHELTEPADYQHLTGGRRRAQDWTAEHRR